jgi:uncharacterized protein
MRAFTPREQKAIRVAAQTMRANPDLDAERVLQELQVGEALVSVLNAKGEPTIVQRTLIRPPMSRVGPLTAEERRALIDGDLGNRRKYRDRLDRPSARARLAEVRSPLGQVRDKVRRFGKLFVVQGGGKAH